MPADVRFLDANVFLRYLTNDVPHQAQAAEQLLRAAARGQMELVTNVLVLAEIVWTLESFYGLSKQDVATKVLAILNTPGLEVERADLALQAATDYAALNIDFIDAYNAAWMRDAGISRVHTFDRKHYRRFGDIEVLVPGI